MLVALVASLSLGLDSEGYQTLEFFAGQARITRLARAVGLRAAAHDVQYDQYGEGDMSSSAMNINTSSGFMPRPQ